MVGNYQRVWRKRSENLHSKGLEFDPLQCCQATVRHHVYAGGQLREERAVTNAKVAGDEIDLSRGRGLGRPAADCEGAPKADGWHQYEPREDVSKKLLRIFPRIRLCILAQLVN